MNEQIPSAAFYGQAVQLPDHMQRAFSNGVDDARDSFDKASVCAKENLKAVDTMAHAAHTSGKQFAERFLSHAEANANAAFDAVTTLARSRTLPEFVRLQTSFMQQQMNVMTLQSHELFQLSAQLAQQAFATFNSAVVKNVDQFKKMPLTKSVQV